MNHLCTYKSCMKQKCDNHKGTVCSDKSCPMFKTYQSNYTFEDFYSLSSYSHLDIPEFSPMSREIRMVYPFSQRLSDILRNPGELRCIVLPMSTKSMMERMRKKGAIREIADKFDFTSNDIQIGVSCVGPDSFLDSITSDQYNQWVLSIKPDFAFSYDAYAYPDFSKCSQWSRLATSITAAHDLAKEVIAHDSQTRVIPFLTANDCHQFGVGVKMLRDIGFQHVSHYFKGFYDHDIYPKGSVRERIQRWVRIFRSSHPRGKLVAYRANRDDALATECDHFVRFSRDV